MTLEDDEAWFWIGALVFGGASLLFTVCLLVFVVGF